MLLSVVFVNQSGGRHTYCIRTGKGLRQRPVPRSKGVSTAKVPVTPRTIYQDFTRGGSVPLRESLNFGLINVILIDARENGRFFHCSDLIIPGSERQKAGKQCSTSDPSNKSRNENKVGMVWVRRAWKNMIPLLSILMPMRWKGRGFRGNIIK